MARAQPSCVSPLPRGGRSWWDIQGLGPWPVEIGGVLEIQEVRRLGAAADAEAATASSARSWGG